ncbi:NAD(P)/FAD-dependent oxidoreductase [Rhodovulum sp. DZ06]|uniref:NAD(P)/FAD-dependent oxidoreductase n=1 Tax=Rhodovulum sp. DZ06 TaxID=3425126 RepID=UPI003D33DDBD
MTVIIIGAGVIGTALALELQRSGRQAVLLDPNAPGSGCSFGNCASLATAGFEPASTPGTWAKVPGWLLDPLGPFRIRPADLPALAPWLIRFALAGRPAALRRSTEGGAALCTRAYADTVALLDFLGAPDMLSANGTLSIYGSDAERKADRGRLALMEQHDLPFEMLSGAALRDREPALTEAIPHALLMEQTKSFADPERYVTLMAERFQALGGRIEQAEAAAVERGEAAAGVRLSDGRTLPAEAVVIAAGARSAALAKGVDEGFPLASERGYHTQLRTHASPLSHALIWPARGFMVTPTAGGIRVGGTVELGDFDAPPDWRRPKATLAQARKIVRGLEEGETGDASEWMGRRPCTPDTIPVLSASAKTKGLFYATGHGHLGLTEAATSAILMGQLIRGETPDVDMSPFRVDRF